MVLSVSDLCRFAAHLKKDMSVKTTSSSLEGIWIIDGEGKTVFANEAMAEILGATTADLIGTDSFHFVCPEDLPAAQRLFSSKQAGNPAPFRFKLCRKDGKWIWVDVQGTPMHNASGQFTGIVGTFTVADQPAS
jgi:PAS domain S-box-containing protein